MRSGYRITYLFLLALAVILIAPDSHAFQFADYWMVLKSQTIPPAAGPFQNMIATTYNVFKDPTSAPTELMPGSVAAVVCSIRLMFCGKVELVIVATAIFLLGLMMLTRKLRWPYALLIIVCIIIFINPELLIKTILSDFMGLNIEPLGWFAQVCTCKYINKIPWF